MEPDLIVKCKIIKLEDNIDFLYHFEISLNIYPMGHTYH